MSLVGKPLKAVGIRLTVAVLSSALLSAAGATAEHSDSRASRPVIAVGELASAPASCQPKAVGRRLLAFSKALRSPDAATLAAFWGSSFHWFTLGRGREGAPVHGGRGQDGPKEALAYLKRIGGLDLRLRDAAINGPGPDGVGVVYRGTVRGFDHSRRLAIFGKGTLSCVTAEIPVWSMAVGGHPSFSVCRLEQRRGRRGLTVCANR
jgi:hypothetical protein